MNFSHINKKDYCLSSTFPKVEKNKKDDKVARKMIEIYAGTKSELTAVCQYMYESFITKYDKHDELSEILENIAICEMNHVDIISQLLLSMDIDPKFCKYIDNNQNICSYWSGGNVKYIIQIDKFIDYNIKLETRAIEDYNELLKITNSKNIKDIVELIIEDEKKHLEIFTQIKLSLESDDSRSSNEEHECTKIENELVNILNVNPSNNKSNNITVKIPISQITIPQDVDVNNNLYIEDDTTELSEEIIDG